MAAEDLEQTVGEALALNLMADGHLPLVLHGELFAFSVRGRRMHCWRVCASQIALDGARGFLIREALRLDV